MRYAALLLLLFVLNHGFTAKAQEPRLVIHNYKKGSDNKKMSNYTMAQFEGRWQEVTRMKTITKENVGITDTLYIHFYNDGKADTKQGNFVVITGTTELFRDDYITTSANDFKVISVATNEIVLDDLTGFLRKMTRKNLFAYEITMSSPVVVTDTLKAMIDLTPASLIKNWFAYKREAPPGFIRSATPMIRNLNITDKLSDNMYKAQIEFAKFGKAYVQPCTLTFTGNMVSIITEDNAWNIEVYKADGQEMIMGKTGELVYYLKNSN